ncbi:40S ribosomal protein S10-1-like [Python bivittatus]|uniref:40S ribosomal protein S10-1-like n=1 Tax=Python bivittatus TaxID=176946 RepID=A0A9F2RBU1_PYTBI|nr:40S ribosomal protein S10-1-like [Python bivittatus]
MCSPLPPPPSLLPGGEGGLLGAGRRERGRSSPADPSFLSWPPGGGGCFSAPFRSRLVPLPATTSAMVAGMLMPLGQLRSIYEVLFRDGVLVGQKDRRPHSFHPQLPGVTHLQVQRAMGSLRSRGLVRENFAWRHCYWYLTDEGIAHLRQYLRLPPEIVPTTLQRVRRPLAVARPASRPPRVQAVRGPLSHPAKPWEASRQEYRRKEEDAGRVELPSRRAVLPLASEEGQTTPFEGGAGPGWGRAPAYPPGSLWTCAAGMAWGVSPVMGLP